MGIAYAEGAELIRLYATVPVRKKNNEERGMKLGELGLTVDRR
jgi:hypothetical protein